MKCFRTTLIATAMVLAPISSFAASTINPNTPAQNAQLNSAPIRSNFQAAYNDINNLLSMYYGPSAPQSPSNLQTWANSSGYPVIVLSYYNSARAAWIAYAQINVTANTYQPLVGAGVAAVPPIGVSYPSGTATFALNYGADFTLAGSSLALAAVNAAPGTYGDATHVAQVSVDAKGRTTAAAQVIITHAANDLVAANNLSDVASPSTARTSLGLGALAVANPGTGLAIDGSGNADLQPGTASVIGGVSAGTGIAISPAGAANLQPAQALTIGGVESDASTAHQWIAYIDSAGVPHQSQPQLSDIGGLTNGITNASLAQAGAATFKGNPTAAQANAQDFTIQGLTADTSPDMVNDPIMIYNHTTGTVQKVSASQLFGSVGNVTSVSNADGTLNVTPTTGAVVASLNPITLPNYLGGLVMSNDAASPTNTLDIEPGSATDSTNATFIRIGAFTKTTAGPWVAGSGNAGMGNLLTVAASTWYDVCLAYNGGVPDVWFDTSATCANKPTGIAGSLYRRLGSVKTDAASHIMAFSQNGDEVIWSTPIVEQSAASIPTTPTLLSLLAVPMGVKVNALLRGIVVAAPGSGNSVGAILLQSPDEAPSQANFGLVGNTDLFAGVIISGTVTSQSGSTLNRRTNTAGQLRESASNSGMTAYLLTYGYIDTRGKEN